VFELCYGPGMAKRVTVDLADLYACLDRARETAGMSWRQVAAATGAPHSTFTRLRHGGGVDTATFLSFVAWLDARPEDFTDGYVDRATRVLALEGRGKVLLGEVDALKQEMCALARRSEALAATAHAAQRDAEAWQYAATSYAEQLGIAREQLQANGIEPDRRIQ
jgi:hypothetical protein